MTCGSANDRDGAMRQKFLEKREIAAEKAG